MNLNFTKAISILKKNFEPINYKVFNSYRKRKRAAPAYL